MGLAPKQQSTGVAVLGAGSTPALSKAALIGLAPPTLSCYWNSDVPTHQGLLWATGNGFLGHVPAWEKYYSSSYCVSALGTSLPLSYRELVSEEEVDKDLATADGDSNVRPRRALGISDRLRLMTS